MTFCKNRIAWLIFKPSEEPAKETSYPWKRFLTHYREQEASLGYFPILPPSDHRIDRLVEWKQHEIPESSRRDIQLGKRADEVSKIWHMQRTRKAATDGLPVKSYDMPLIRTGIERLQQDNHFLLQTPRAVQ